MKIFFGIIVFITVLFGGFLVIKFMNTSEKAEISSLKSATGNISVIDGQQIIEITVKGGYQPRVSTVKAGIPVVIRFITNGTFDCSSSIRIPSMNISRSLPPSGSTDIVLGKLDPGIVQGMCGMGMYQFQINVEN